MRLRLAILLKYGVDGHTAGDFSCLEPAHAIRQDVQIHVRREAVAIFVIFADASDVGPRPKFHLRGHSLEPPKSSDFDSVDHPWGFLSNGHRRNPAF
jgi:hypothetical protein